VPVSLFQIYMNVKTFLCVIPLSLLFSSNKR